MFSLLNSQLTDPVFTGIVHKKEKELSGLESFV